ncbi:hypothetical protein, partial [Streptococcus pyogenes]|uniref:hypothetical protein n=2 Tax=Streptococcus pyogenes TaxID=1314 RepID=UPI001B352337
PSDFFVIIISKGGDYMAKDLLEVTSEIIIGNHESFYREFRAAKNESIRNFINTFLTSILLTSKTQT